MAALRFDETHHPRPTTLALTDCPKAAAMNDSFNALYRDVPPEHTEALRRFRDRSPVRSLRRGTTSWHYHHLGESSAGLLFLPGALGRSEMGFHQYLELASDFRVIAMDYASVLTMDEIADAAVAIMDREGVERTQVIGSSYGGLVAQVLVRRRPDRVNSVVLSHTGTPNAGRVWSNRLALGLLRILPGGLVRAAMRSKIQRLLGRGWSEASFWNTYAAELTATGRWLSQPCRRRWLHQA